MEKRPERSDFKPLEEARNYGMARAALRLPNAKNKAEGNSTHVRFESAQKVWEDLIAAGLARRRKALPFQGAHGAVYELTELGISVVLEEGESRGALGVSPETDLVPLDGVVVPEQAVAVPSAPPSAAKPLPEAPAAIGELAVPVSVPSAAICETANIVSATEVTAEVEAQVANTVPVALPEAPEIEEPMTIQAATTKLIGRSQPCEPDDPTEWLLEQAAFQAANAPDVPAWAQNVIKALWEEVVHREAWRQPTDAETPAPALKQVG